MADSTDNGNQINTNAQGPKSTSVDGQSVEMHSIADQIAADKYAAAKAASRRGGMGGIRWIKLRPPSP